MNIPSQLSQRILQLSFAPTQRAREQLYADCVLQEWAPDALKRMQDLAQREAQLRAEQEQLE